MSKNRNNKVIVTEATRVCSPPRQYATEEFCEEYTHITGNTDRTILSNAARPFYDSPATLTFFNNDTSTGNVTLTVGSGLSGEANAIITISPGNSATVSMLRMSAASVRPAAGAIINGKSCLKIFKRVNL